MDLITDNINLAYAYARNRDEAGLCYHEALSDAHEALIKSAKNYVEEEGAFSTLFSRIVKNIAINRHKKQQRDVLTNTDMELCPTGDSHIGEPWMQPFESVTDADVDKNILKCIDSLAENEKTIVFQYYYKSRTLKEISEHLGISKQATEQKIKQARQRLKRCFMQLGIDDD